MRKKILVGVVAVGIAAMLVALPYESNAIVPIVALGIGIAIGVGGTLLYNWLTDKNEHSNVIYRPNWSAVADEIQSFFSKKDEQYNQMVNDIQAMVEIYDNTDLYFQRVGEKLAINLLNHSTWGENETNYVCAEFDNFTKSLYMKILMNYIKKQGLYSFMKSMGTSTDLLV